MSWHYLQGGIWFANENVHPMPDGVWAKKEGASILLEIVRVGSQGEDEEWEKNRAASWKEIRSEIGQGWLCQIVCEIASVLKREADDARTQNGDGTFAWSGFVNDRTHSSQERKQTGQQAGELGIDNAIESLKSAWEATNPQKRRARSLCVSLPCLPVQEEASWAGTYLDGAPSALSSMMPTPAASSLPGNATAACHDSQSGTTCEPSTGTHGEDTLTSSPEDSRVRTSAQQEKGQESTANAPACGARWRELWARYDLASSGWKTHRCLWTEDLPWSSVTLPKWGMMRDGVLWERITPEPRTSETGVGFWRTPAAYEPGISPERLVPIPGGTLGGMNRHFDRETGRMAQIGLEQQVRLRQQTWPTPRAGNPGSRPNGKGGKILDEEVKIAEGMKQRNWPTPTACMSKGSSQESLFRKDGNSRESDRLDHAVMAQNGGQLNPNWVEWLMGWPLGWTSMEPMPELTWAAWRRAFKSGPTDSSASATGKCPQP